MKTHSMLRNVIIAEYRKTGINPRIIDISKRYGLCARTIKMHKRAGFDFEVLEIAGRITVQEMEALMPYWRGVRPYSKAIHEQEKAA